MLKIPKITVFEHQCLKIGQSFKDAKTQKKIIIQEKHRKTLERFYGEKGVPYYKLIHKGVQFCEYVGVLHLGDLVIEILPKTDKSKDKMAWRKVLIGMLKSVGVFKTTAPSSAHLSLKSNFILF